LSTSIAIKLTKIPDFDENTVVTKRADGTPLSYIYSDHWDYSGSQTKGAGKGNALKVPFHTIDSSFRKGIQSTLLYISKCYKKQHKAALTASKVADYKSGFVTVCNALESCHWDVLSDDGIYRSFERKLVKLSQVGGFSRSYLDNVIRVLNLLNKYNLCRRHVDGKELKSKCQIKDGEQHIAIPISMYQVILSEAIQTVETYHEHRHEIARVMKVYYEIEAEEKADTRKSQLTGTVSSRTIIRVDKIKHNIPDFLIRGDATFLNKIMYHCMLATLAFSGVRIGEAVSFSKNSYTDKIANGNEIPVLRGETTKGNDGIPKAETWQTHPVVKDALELAYDMTENLRTMYKQRLNEQLNDGALAPEKYKAAMSEVNGAFIPLFPSRVKTTYVQTNMSKVLARIFQTIAATQADVDEFNRLNPSRIGQLKVGGSLPKLSPHDFRRTFAVFFKRYGFGSASTIKFQYKHDNINMSDYYANNATLQAMEDVLLDTDLLKIMNDEGINMAVDTFDEIYNKSECLSGIEGERIAKDKYQKIKSGHDVYLTRSEIEVLVRNGSLSIVKLPTGGYCINATCSRVCGITQFSAEKKPCDHQIITDNQAKVILRQNNRLIKTFRALNTGDQLESSNLIALKQKIKRNEITIQQHNLKFEAFNDEVKGVVHTKVV